MNPVIDAHQHFWDFANSDRFDYGWLAEPQHAPIRRSYLPEDLRPRIDEVGVQRTIFVQTQHNLGENEWALRLAEQHDFLAGVVGWVDLASEECEQQLSRFRDHPYFVGVRHITQDEPDDDFILRDDVLCGLKVLERHQVPFDLLFYVRHLKHAATVAGRLPDLPLVIDHLAKPGIKDQRTDNWREAFQAAAACPNVFCKLSGMITQADWHTWQPADLAPYVTAAVELFGPDRLMFGSDWPVCELAGSYRQVIEALGEVLGGLSDSERAKIFGGTAQRFYNLPPAITG
ncbi:MAG: amidohydrolase family protein [Planctomycetales bacterium]|nr:amidohydrolase family protein [Planctomycetales bacterium]NIM07966.1 amidohydrolase family protein [Planctomycetales bacterium]NIN07444.1 amidohydrolase family protein [Planctomycetales bacterium]NIN76551.1 amidohydrolase family protein [Planctomycetales bacterium]NIO33738.1 amidohydrolase family protein [Planctomycetales bacterium]